MMSKATMSAFDSWWVFGMSVAVGIMSFWTDFLPLLMLALIGNAVSMGLWNLHVRLRLLEDKMAAKELVPSIQS